MVVLEVQIAERVFDKLRKACEGYIGEPVTASQLASIRIRIENVLQELRARMKVDPHLRIETVYNSYTQEITLKPYLETDCDCFIIGSTD